MRVRVLQRGPGPCSLFLPRDLEGVHHASAVRVAGTGERLDVAHYSQVSGRLRLRRAPRVPLDETCVLVIGGDEPYAVGDAVYYDGRRAVVRAVGVGEYGQNVTLEVGSATIKTTPGLDARFSREAP